jgi:hypothetical protein
MEKPSHSDEAIEECLKDLVCLKPIYRKGLILMACRVSKYSTGGVWIWMRSPFARLGLTYVRSISNGVAVTQLSEHGPRRRAWPQYLHWKSFTYSSMKCVKNGSLSSLTTDIPLSRALSLVREL